jgi:hypothetical protein
VGGGGGLAYYEHKNGFMFCVPIRILPYRKLIYDIKQMICVQNSVRQSSLNYTIYIIDSTVIETFIIIKNAGNKIGQKHNSHQQEIKRQQLVIQ